MNDRRHEDLLDEYSRLVTTRSETGWLAQLPEVALALAPFLALTRELATLIAPIRPRPEYRTALYQSLLVTARQQQAQRRLDLPAGLLADPFVSRQVLTERVSEWVQQGQDWQSEHPWVVGAAVGSAVSFLGIAAYLLRYRGRRTAA